MFHIVICFIVILMCTIFSSLTNCQDKLVLNPEELVNLIIEEQIKREIPVGVAWENKFGLDRNQSTQKNTNSTKLYVHYPNAIEEAIDMPPENKKVWSRWGKWGACSVTCGQGCIVRRRLCVAGRCAPGELEEQRRLCVRDPCQVARTALTEDEPEQD